MSVVNDRVIIVIYVTIQREAQHPSPAGERRVRGDLNKAKHYFDPLILRNVHEII